MHQLHEYNEETQGGYVRPVIDLHRAVSNWSKLTSGLQAEEVADLERARQQLENYQRIYEIYEYASELNRLMNVLETRIFANNSLLVFNAYRFSRSSKIENLLPEIEKCLQAYYGLIDDCEGHPDWQKKIVKELGSTVSFLTLTIDESGHSELMKSDVFRRFDMEKQRYFK